MVEFSPPPGYIIEINGSKYEVCNHPEANHLAFGIEQGEAIVYQIKNLSHEYFALKIFKSDYPKDNIIQKTTELKKFSKLNGLSVCNRTCLTESNSRSIRQHPELKNSILMPWIKGETWSSIIQKKFEFKKSHSLGFAKKLSDVMYNLEKHNLAHCDISDGNVILDIENGGYVELIDIEHLYYKNSNKPEHLPAGSNGYAHKEAKQGLWSETSDRFALAILLTEIICWHNKDFRDSVVNENIFPQDFIHASCEQYLLAKKILSTFSKKLVSLFESAWSSEYIIECPTAFDWFSAIDNISNPSPVKGWKPLLPIKNNNIRSKSNPKPPTVEQITKSAHSNAPELFYSKDQDGFSSGVIRWITNMAETDFELQVAKDVNFKEVIKISKIIKREFILSELSPDVYFLRVRAIKDGGLGGWSNVLKISINEK
ncbi:MAG: protein kinase [Anaerolineales bacterium]|nr:protein kinase [Anaerolineales bacterium]